MFKMVVRIRTNGELVNTGWLEKTGIFETRNDNRFEIVILNGRLTRHLVIV